MNRLCPVCDSSMLYLQDKLLTCEKDNLFVWAERNSVIYGDDYLLHYKLYARTELSKDLCKSRWDFVRHYVKDGILLDFGCGAEAFGKDNNGNGFKVFNYDPFFNQDHAFLEYNIDVLTLWDSFEHMERITLIPLLDAKYVFISIPILDNLNSAIKEDFTNLFNWKHFRPYEHIWYFSSLALIRLFERWRYTLIARNDFEAKLRSPDIISFAFKRIESTNLTR